MSTNPLDNNQPPSDGKSDATNKKLANTVRIPPRPVMMPRADLNPQRNGSINNATTELNQAGVAEVNSKLLPYIRDSYEQRKTDTPPLYDLNPQIVVAKAAQLLSASSPLASPVGSKKKLDARYRSLTILSQGHPSEYEASIDEAVTQAIRDCFEPILASSERVAKQNPFALGKLIKNIREMLHRVKYAKQSSGGLRRLQRLRDFLEMLERDRSSVPAHKIDDLTRSALHYSQEACKLQLHSLVAEAVTKQFQAAAASLLHRCDTWEKLTQACAEHFDAVQNLLREEERQTKHAAAAAVSDGRIMLPGPSKEATLKALCDSYNYSSADLIKELATRYASGLCDQVAEQLEDNAGPLDAFRLALPSDGVSVLKSLVNERLDDLSIYVAIDRYGVDDLVAELVATAAPLVHLSRSNVLNNIELIELSVLTLPHPIGSRDEEIMERVKTSARQAIESLGIGALEIRVNSSVGQSCHLTRTVMGYPAAAQSELYALADAYVKSHDLNHCCHLFNALPDSPDGKASPIVIEIFLQLEKEEKPWHQQPQN